MSNTIYFSGSGKLDLSIPAFDYEELSGIKLNWKGLSGHTDYKKISKVIAMTIWLPPFKSNWRTRATFLWKTYISNLKPQAASTNCL